MRKYDTVLFDLDGTLLNTLDDLADSVNHILTANGCPLRSREEVRSFLGTGSRRLMAQALPQGENTPDFEQLLSRRGPGAGAAEAGGLCRGSGV